MIHEKDKEAANEYATDFQSPVATLYAKMGFLAGCEYKNKQMLAYGKYCPDRYLAALYDEEIKKFKNEKERLTYFLDNYK